jgi:hypothetical protein
LIVDPDDTLRIGSEFADIIVVNDWTPDDAETNVLHGSSVLANMEATNTAEKEILYDEASDFDTGVHNDTRAIGTELQ